MSESANTLSANAERHAASSEEPNWHGTPLDEVFAQLETRREGLTEVEAASRRARHGDNVLEAEPACSRVAMLAAQFADLMVLILAHVMAVRSEQTSLLALGVRTNMPLLVAVLLTIGLQLAIVYVPLLNTLFKTVPLSAGEMLVCIACGIVILVGVELEKAMRRHREAERERP